MADVTKTAISGVVSREGLLSKFKNTPPILEGDYLLKFEVPTDYSLSLSELGMVIVGFTIPQLGISFQNSSELLGASVSSIQNNSFTIRFIAETNVQKDKPLSLIHALYNKQFNKNGTLKFIKKGNGVDIHFFTKIAGDGSSTVKELVTFYDCKVSYPAPTVNLQGIQASVYSVDVSFRDYKEV